MTSRGKVEARSSGSTLTEFPAIERARLLFEERLRTRQTQLGEAFSRQLQGAARTSSIEKGGISSYEGSSTPSQVGQRAHCRRLPRKPPVPVQRRRKSAAVAEKSDYKAQKGTSGPRFEFKDNEKRDHCMKADIRRALGRAVERHVGMLFDKDHGDESEDADFVAFHYVKKGMHKSIRAQVEADFFGR